MNNYLPKDPISHSDPYIIKGNRTIVLWLEAIRTYLRSVFQDADCRCIIRWDVAKDQSWYYKDFTA